MGKSFGSKKRVFVQNCQAFSCTVKYDFSKLKESGHSVEIFLCHFIDFDDYLVRFQLPGW